MEACLATRHTSVLHPEQQHQHSCLQVVSTPIGGSYSSEDERPSPAELAAKEEQQSSEFQ